MIYRNPNGENGEQIWKPSSPNNLEYLHIHNLTLTMKSHYFMGDEYRFWKEIGSPTLCHTLSTQWYVYQFSLEYFSSSVHHYCCAADILKTVHLIKNLTAHYWKYSTRSTTSLLWKIFLRAIIFQSIAIDLTWLIDCTKIYHETEIVHVVECFK